MNLHCPTCQKEYPLTKELHYICATCQGNLEVLYDYDALKQQWDRDKLSQQAASNLWRYLPLLPNQEGIDAPPLGWTPCFQYPKLAQECDIDKVWIKNDSINPSASFKDRASAVAIKWAAEQGHTIITAASTGNAGAAAALWSSVIGVTARIFLPASAPPAKVTQLQVFGAETLLIDGNYDCAFELCLEATKKYGWYNRNTGYNPLTREGKKTVSFEIAEQCGWQLPDYIVVPVGDGNIISGVWKGFVELHKMGWIEQCPKLLAVQSEGSDAITSAWESKAAISTISADTIADSISVDYPRDGNYAVRAIQESDGIALRVSDKQILEAIPHLAQTTGIFAEPAAATSLAGLREARRRELIPKDASALLLITGHGLKDIQAVQSILPLPDVLPPDLNAISF